MYLIWAFVFIFGTILGSFLNVLIHRLPTGENWVSKRSYCPKCNIQIPLYRNIPIVTYLVQIGKCHHCENKISIRYPVIELLTGICAVLLLPSSLSVDSLFNYFFLFSILCSFVVHFVVDLKHHILPDEINIYLALLFGFYGFFHQSILHMVVGGVFGFFLPYSVAYLFYKFRGVEGLGGGDIKLFGALGLYLGVKGIILNIFMSCFLGSIVGVGLIILKAQDKNKPIAFGPFIIIAGFLQIFFPGIVLKATKTLGLLM